MNHCYILGLGSPHGWDRLGWLTIDQLRIDMEARANLTLAQLSQPIDLFSQPLDNGDRLLLVDAVLADEPVGTIRWYTAGQLPEPGRPLSSHGIDINAVIDLLLASGFPKNQLCVAGMTVPDTEHPDTPPAIHRLACILSAAIIQRQIIHRPDNPCLSLIH